MPFIIPNNSHNLYHKITRKIKFVLVSQNSLPDGEYIVTGGRDKVCSI